MRAALKLIVPVAVLALIAAGVGLDLWGPWRPETHKTDERELAWMRSVATWVLSAPARHLPRAACTAAFDRQIGAPPSDRLEPAARIVRNGCGRGNTAEHWLGVERQAWSNLIDSRFAAADATEEPQLASPLKPFVRRGVSVHCWPQDAWDALNEERQIFDPTPWGVAGFADLSRHAIHVSEDYCEPLRRFFGTLYAPYLNEAEFYLSYALGLLVHEGEHVHHPYASEATVECYAVQDVRELVLNTGRGKGYANEMAALNWDLSYPRLPAPYQTRKCRNGGALDLHPRSSLWP